MIATCLVRLWPDWSSTSLTSPQLYGFELMLAEVLRGKRFNYRTEPVSAVVVLQCTATADGPTFLLYCLNTGGLMIASPSLHLRVSPSLFSCCVILRVLGFGVQAGLCRTQQHPTRVLFHCDRCRRAHCSEGAMYDWTRASVV